MAETGGWVAWSPDGPNEHLASEDRERLQREWDEQRARRGRQLASVVVEVFENGDAVPHVQLPEGSPIESGNVDAIANAVRLAAEALVAWE